jgi:ankyrin repeat protein
MEHKSNLDWKAQMIELCPALKVCCNCLDNNIKYEDIVKEIIEIKEKYENTWWNSIKKNIKFLEDDILKIIVSTIFLSFPDYVNLHTILKNYLKENITKINKETLNKLFINCCSNYNREGDTEIIKLLLDHSKKYPESINLGSNNNEAFMEACIYGHTSIIKLLLDYSIEYPGIINPYAEDNKALARVCERGSSEQVKILLEYFKNHSDSWCAKLTCFY